MRLRYLLTPLFGVLLFSTVAAAQTDSREATREKLRAVLTANGPKVNIDFRQSDQNEWNFVGVLRTGLTNADSFEVVVGVTKDQTIGFRVFPHYHGGYINLNRAGNPLGLARKLLQLSNTNFMFWGADESGDIFSGYTLTLESGFPLESLRVVLWSIKPLDQYVGEIKPMVDGAAGSHGDR